MESNSAGFQTAHATAEIITVHFGEQILVTSIILCCYKFVGGWGETILMISEAISIIDDTSCPSTEDILRRFHHSVRLHYEHYANLSLDDVGREDFSAMASISNMLLVGNNSAAGLLCQAQSCS